jgi:hypothetical protein
VVLDDATAAWVDEALTFAGIARTGPIALFRERIWATVWSAPTSAGTVWLKAGGAGSAFEPALYEILTDVVPERVLRPLAVDPSHGRLLLPDAGPAVGDRYTGDDLVTAMARAVRAYAGLQQRLTPHAGRMLAIGLADMSPAVLPCRFDEALAGVTEYAATEAGPDDRAAHARLAALPDRYASWCDELSAAGIAPSLDHNDLHAHNVLGDGPAERLDARFYDWGDAVLAHPFASLLFLLDTMPAEAGPTLRCAYLAEWGEPRELEAVARLAVRTALVARALVWVRTLAAAPADHEHAGQPLAHLLRLLDGRTAG